MKNIAAIIILMSVTLASCVKQGPMGPMGQNGYNGLDGATGPTGPTGNANVLGYTSLVVPPNGWTASSGNGNTTVTGGYYFYANFAYNMNDAAAVLVYYKSFNTWIPLSWVNNDLEYSFDNTTTNLQITLQSASGKTVVAQPTVNDTFKLVVIPPALKAQNPKVNFQDPMQVKRLLNF